MATREQIERVHVVAARQSCEGAAIGWLSGPVRGDGGEDIWCGLTRDHGDPSCLPHPSQSQTTSLLTRGVGLSRQEKSLRGVVELGLAFDVTVDIEGHEQSGVRPKSTEFAFYPLTWVYQHNRRCIGPRPVKCHRDDAAIRCAPVKFSEARASGRAVSTVEEVLVTETP